MMNIKLVSTADFIRHFGRYHDEAQREPLMLTKHGRASLVVVSAEMFAKLTDNADPRRVYGEGEAPSALADLLATELERQSAEYQDGKHE